VFFNFGDNDGDDDVGPNDSGFVGSATKCFVIVGIACVGNVVKLILFLLFSLLR